MCSQCKDKNTGLFGCVWLLYFLLNLAVSSKKLDSTNICLKTLKVASCDGACARRTTKWKCMPTCEGRYWPDRSNMTRKRRDANTINQICQLAVYRPSRIISHLDESIISQWPRACWYILSAWIRITSWLIRALGFLTQLAPFPTEPFFTSQLSSHLALWQTSSHYWESARHNEEPHWYRSCSVTVFALSLWSN